MNNINNALPTAAVSAPAPIAITKKDIRLGLLAGFLMGLLFMPILNAAKPDLYSMLKFFIVPFFLIAMPVGLFVASLLAKPMPIIWQLAKFVVTGGLNALMDLGVLSLLIFLLSRILSIQSTQVIVNLGIVIITVYSLCKAASFIVANINSYLWNKYWTFKPAEAAGQGEKKNQFASFFLVSLVGFFINVFVASFVFKSINPLFNLNIDQWGLIGAAAGSIAGLVWNFVGYKFFVFKK